MADDIELHAQKTHTSSQDENPLLRQSGRIQTEDSQNSNSRKSKKSKYRNFDVPHLRENHSWGDFFTKNPENRIRFVKHQPSIARFQSHDYDDDDEESMLEMDELLSWNLPTTKMTTEYINDYVERTGSDTILFGRAKKGISVGGEVVRPILCSREKPLEHDAIYNRGPVAPAGMQLGPTYLVVGILRRRTTVPDEITVPIWPERDLIEAIRSGSDTLRGSRRWISLRYVAGFSIYRCHTVDGFHSQVQIDERTRNALVQLYADGFGFGKHSQDTRTNEAWKPWIHKHSNSGTYDAKDGKYSLQLQLAWSPYRIMALASTPILLSLAIGIWYDVHYEEPEVAFVIATYVATAGGVLVAIISAVVALSE